MTVKTMSVAAISVLVIIGLTGCASTTPQVRRDAHVTPAVLDEARYQAETTRQTNTLVYRLGTAGADQCSVTDATHRAPFSLLFNGANTSEELRTAIYRVSGATELPVVQGHTPELKRYDGARVRTVNRQNTDNINLVYSALRDALEERASLVLTLEDGRSLTTAPVSACPSFVLTDYAGQLREVFNNLNGLEVIPRSWLQLARNDDERAFILARSLYFTGADGDPKLRHAFYGGAVVSGIVRGLTFGLGTLFVDPKAIAVRMRRSAARADADAFALTVMQRAGFNPHSALEFALRSAVEGRSWPEETDELRFDTDRIAALRRNLPR